MEALTQLTESSVLKRVMALCEVPSVSGSEDRISSRSAEILSDDGLDVVQQEVLPGRRNVIATYRSGRPGPRILLNGHLDTLPPARGYTREPYRAVVENGRLYAAEVNNMKGAVGSMMAVMALLPQLDHRLVGEVVLSAVIGECDALGVGTVAMLEGGLRADCCINGEPTDLAVMTAHAGVTQLSLNVFGRCAHISQREQGLNAIDKLVQLLPKIGKQALTHRPHPDFPGLPTVNIGTIRGGSMPSMLAELAEAGIDVRTVPGMTPESVLRDFTSVIHQAQAADPALSAEVRLSERPAFCQERPFHMDPDDPLVQAVREAHLRVTGNRPKVGTLLPQVFFGTDASHILAAGIPTVIYGPGRVTDINTANESMATADLVTAAKVYLTSLLGLAGSEAQT